MLLHRRLQYSTILELLMYTYGTCLNLQYVKFRILLCEQIFHFCCGVSPLRAEGSHAAKQLRESLAILWHPRSSSASRLQQRLVRLDNCAKCTSSLAFRRRSSDLKAQTETTDPDSVTSREPMSCLLQCRATGQWMSVTPSEPNRVCVRCTRRRRPHSRVACVSCAKRELSSSPALRTPTGRSRVAFALAALQRDAQQWNQQSQLQLTAEMGGNWCVWLHTVRIGRFDSTLRGALVATALTSESDQIARSFSAAESSNCEAISRASQQQWAVSALSSRSLLEMWLSVNELRSGALEPLLQLPLVYFRHHYVVWAGEHLLLAECTAESNRFQVVAIDTTRTPVARAAPLLPDTAGVYS